MQTDGDIAESPIAYWCGPLIYCYCIFVSVICSVWGIKLIMCYVLLCTNEKGWNNKVKVIKETVYKLLEGKCLDF